MASRAYVGADITPFCIALQPFGRVIGQTPMMAPPERPATLLARVRTQLEALRAAIFSFLGGQKPSSSDGGTGGAVG